LHNLRHTHEAKRMSKKEYSITRARHNFMPVIPYLCAVVKQRTEGLFEG